MVCIAKPLQAAGDTQWRCDFNGYYSIPFELKVPVANPEACLAFCRSKLSGGWDGERLVFGEYFCIDTIPRQCIYPIDWPEWLHYKKVTGGVYRCIAYHSPQDYIIKLSRADYSSIDYTILEKIEPSKLTTFIAKVYDQNNRSIPNVEVQLSLEAKHGSGGHNHGDDTVTLRTGTLDGQKVLTGRTDPNGFQFKYKAPDVSGDINIKASCMSGNSCAQQGPDTVWVGIKELIPLPDTGMYVLLPNRDTNHPANHYMAYGASIKLMQLADLYRRRFSGDPLLHVNDASLERGGLFDIDSNWSYLPRGHKSHRRGEAADIRANPDFNPKEAIPVRNFEKFEEIALEVGGNAKIHSPGGSNQHYHVEF